MAFTEGYYYDPRVDKPLLREHSKGLVALTACLAGEVPRLARQGDMDGARRAAREYKEIFEPGCFFLEVQSNGMKEQLEVNARLAELGQSEGIPLAATADAHYVKREDAKAHDVLMCIASGKTFSDPKRLCVLESLASGELSVGDLSTQVGCQVPNMSQHLAVLRSAGLVTTRREGSTVFYRLTDPRVLEAYRLIQDIAR